MNDTPPKKRGQVVKIEIGPKSTSWACGPRWLLRPIFVALGCPFQSAAPARRAIAFPSARVHDLEAALGEWTGVTVVVEQALE